MPPSFRTKPPPSLRVSGASDWIRSYLSRDLSVQSYVRHFSGRGTATLFLPDYPATAVTEVLVDGRSIPALVADESGSRGWALDGSLIRLRGYLFTRGTLNVRVTYQAGYALVPPAIERAACMMAATRYRAKDRIGQLSKAVGTEVINFQPDDVTKDIREVLQQYRQVVPA